MSLALEQFKIHILGGNMTTVPTLTAEEVREEWIASIPLNRIDLVGVRLVEGCALPDLDITDITSTGVSLTFSPAAVGKKFEFDGVIPWKDIPDAMISVHEMACLAEDLGEDTHNYALLTLVKRVARVKIEYGCLGHNEIEVTLSCGSGSVALTCTISDLAGFAKLVPGAREECEKRIEREVAEMPDFVASSALSELREPFTGRVAPAPTLDD